MVTVNASRPTAVLGEERVRTLGTYLTRAEQKELLNGTVTDKDMAAAEAAIRRIKAANRNDKESMLEVAQALVADINALRPTRGEPRQPPGLRTREDDARRARETVLIDNR